MSTIIRKIITLMCAAVMVVYIFVYALYAIVSDAISAYEFVRPMQSMYATMALDVFIGLLMVLFAIFILHLIWIEVWKQWRNR